MYTLAQSDTYFENVKGSNFTATVKARLKNAKAGDLITVTNIRAKGPSSIVWLNGPVLTVK